MCEKIKSKSGKKCVGPECLVELMPENESVFEMYNMLRGQLIMSAAGTPIDIDIVAVDRILKRCGHDGREMFDRVVMILRHMLDKTRSE